MDRDTILRLRPFFESAAWGNFEDFLETRLEHCHKVIEGCPIEKVDYVRGQINIFREILEYKKAARTAYKESKSE